MYFAISERDALSAQVVQMREALEMISNTTDETGVCGNGYSASHVAEQALTLDTNFAELLVAKQIAERVDAIVYSRISVTSIARNEAPYMNITQKGK
jgi:hypothetical protein